MNKLNTFLSFVLLSFCLLINVSYGETIEANVTYSKSTYNVSYPSSFGSYSNSIANKIVNDYVADSSTYEADFNALCEDVYSTYGYNSYLLIKNYNVDGTLNSSKHILLFFNSKNEVGVCSTNKVNNSVYFLRVNLSVDDTLLEFCTGSTAGNIYIYTITKSGTKAYSSYYSLGLSSNRSIKEVIIDDSSNSMVWDGTSYYYEVPSDEPDEPIMPTNSEIASVVQSFYDSNLYKNNTNFKDFMVVYSFEKGNYSIIGTDNHLLQEIYYDGAKPSNDDFTYPETWWRFYNYLGNVQNLFQGWNYWLYNTRKEDGVFLPISYHGVGKINDLFNLKFTNQNIIVYSSYEYEVYEFRPPTEEGGENQVTNTTVPGDEYTYNENLDPTDSSYSPIQNYIPTNPTQSILGNVDFSEINKTFEENKNILNIENASWLFTANNKLVDYFTGFLSFLMVLIIISRLLGG